MLRAYPRAGFIGLPYGLDLVNDLAVMKPGKAQRLDDMEYNLGSLRRRGAFVDYYSGTVCEMSEAVEYIDFNGEKRIIASKKTGDDSIPSIFELTPTEVIARVTNLTLNRYSSFAQILGACFHQNGEDLPLRGDGVNWRVAGAPPAVGNFRAVLGGTGGVTGTRNYMVTACIKQDDVVILESDHSLYVNVSPTSNTVVCTWDASPDTRVNWYRVYKNKANQGSPFYLAGEGNALAFTDTEPDSSLTLQTSAPLGDNGTMPVASIVTQCGRRLVCASLNDATDPLADKSLHISLIARNRYSMEYFPQDGYSRFYLPSPGPITAAYPFGSQNAGEDSTDLLVGQPNALYKLPGTNPTKPIKLISNKYGVVGKKAIVAWGANIFFVSKDGLMFMDSSEVPVLVSQDVNPVFLGGGALNTPKNYGEEYITLALFENKLLITLRDDSGKTWGNKALVLDLERFIKPATQNSAGAISAYFTGWKGNGLGWSFFLPTSDGALLLFDNQNTRVLKRIPIGFQDSVGGVLKLIPGRIWSFGIGAIEPESMKTARQVNLVLQSGDVCSMDLEADYGEYADRNAVVPRSSKQVVWDKDWDKPWFRTSSNFVSVFFTRAARGRLFQMKLKVENRSYEFTFIGLSMQFSSTLVRRFIER